MMQGARFAVPGISYRYNQYLMFAKRYNVMVGGRSSQDMLVFWVRQPDLGSVHPARGSGPRVARVVSKVRRLRTYAGGNAHLLRTRWKNLLQDGLPQVRAAAVRILHCIYKKTKPENF